MEQVRGWCESKESSCIKVKFSLVNGNNKDQDKTFQVLLHHMSMVYGKRFHPR